MVGNVHWNWLKALLAASGMLAACNGSPDVPRNPTWADVEPILRANCNHCHGPTAATTGAKGGLVYRFDFYDMNDGTCGEAALALEPGQSYAAGWAALIKDSITPKAGDRPRMPPAPARALADWEFDTVVRWASAQVPPRGVARRDNRRPQTHVEIPVIADTLLTVRASVDDPDGESVVGVVNIGSFKLRMNRPGTFSTTIDTAKWPTGFYDVSAVVCDGWSAVRYGFGQLGVLHGQAQASRPIAAEREDGAPIGGGDAGVPGTSPPPPMMPPRDAGSGPILTVPDAAPPALAHDAGAGGPGSDAQTPALDTTPASVGECPDLDGNGVLDCKESLVKNPDFDRDATSWQPEVGAMQAFAPEEDAHGKNDSGALAVTNASTGDSNGSSMRAAWQCLPAKPGTAYDVYGQAFIPGGQSSGGAAIAAWFYGSADCSGTLLGANLSTPMAATNRWHLLSALATAPAGSGSMAIRLAVSKPFKNQPLRILFDNILVRAR